jgi:nucleoside-diphosphate-sugar epimerase
VRIFIAGATGVLGIRLVPLLVAEGHVVTGMTRSPAKAGALRELDAEAVVCDVFDARALRAAVIESRADSLIHLLTDLPDDAAELERFTDANARIRREGTGNLIDAARAGGVERFLAESIVARLPGDAGAAVDDLERAVLEIDGVVLRYGWFYGPGTYWERELPDPPRVHLIEAARQTALALRAPPGVIEIVDPA